MNSRQNIVRRNQILKQETNMNKWQNLITLVVVLCLSICSGSRFGICWADDQTGEPQADAEKAHLKIDGKFILSLVLDNKDGQPIAIVSSEQTEVGFEYGYTQVTNPTSAVIRKKNIFQKIFSLINTR